MLPTASTYEDLVAAFAWRIPERFNIGADVAARWARDDPQRLALIDLADDGTDTRYRFVDIARLANRLANTLTALGLARGDRVGVLLPQRVETALTHVAVTASGAISLPLFTLFGPEALEYRLADSGARIVVTNVEGAAKLAPLRDRLPDLVHVLCVDGAPAGTLDFHGALDAASDRFTPVATAADDPALIIYTSGTTGNPKGALHAHRVLLGHLPGVEFPHSGFPKAGDLFWTPADWAWIGGLLDVLLPAWHHGVPVLAHRMRKFDPEHAFRLIATYGVRNVFLPPTALKLMRQIPDPSRFGHRVRSVASGGESLGEELLDWGRAAFGTTINEFYGQTECNLVIGNDAAIMPVHPGSMGRAIPGHSVDVIDPSGNPLADGETGMIGIRRPDPVMFLGYWKNPTATEAKFAGDYLLTGDLGRRDSAGYFTYVGRDDDVITSAGYRIGPAEIENCLMRHPAVAMAAVIGVPDPVRTEIVKAFIVPKDGFAADDALAGDIQAFVKERLAAYEYPRAVAFVQSLPMTTTGKIMRRELRKHEA